MSDDLVARTPSGDLKGTVSVDGFDGRFLDKLRARAGMRGYWPIGVSLSLGDPDGGRTAGERSISVDVIGVDAGEVGVTVPTIKAHAAKAGTLLAYKFPVEVTASELLQLIKSLNAVVLARDLQGLNIELADGR
jgi:hypothetical protein